MKIEYQVDEITTMVGEGLDPDNYGHILAWEITRYAGGFGWVVTKYRDEEVANRVARTLNDHTDQEVS